MRILCGDIGGTKTHLQLVEVHDDNPSNVSSKLYSSIEYVQFDSILEDFFSTEVNKATISAVCFGVAGPVIKYNNGQSASITNLPWRLDSTELANRHALTAVTLINDFEAIGYGISALGKNDLVSLQSGVSIKHGNQLIVGAGTGLGVTQLVWNGDHYLIIPTEGGHIEFAPATNEQLHLADYLLTHKGRNSIEFVLSGQGLVNIFQFICQSQQLQGSEQYNAITHAADPAAAITAAANSNPESPASSALRLFVEAYGSQVGNFALSSLALGGVYIAGGIAAKILPQLQSGEFVTAFNAKGKMASLMEKIAVQVITNPEVGLIGCRVYAERFSE